LPQVRKALNSENPQVRHRAIRVVAWQGDRDSVAALQTLQRTDAKDADLIGWAIDKIQSLHPTT
jgi:HEAT repeat protein